jgi:hypothetical protein
MKNIILGAAAVVILGLAVFLYFWRSPGPSQFNEFVTPAVDLETGQELRVTYKLGERAPFVNPATGKRTVYPWYFCQDCRKRFVPDLVPSADGGPPRLPAIPICPLCGGSRTGGWMREDPDQAEPAGDAPLPKLPK